ncbi:MAG: Asp-tRNA(Asn)/Glu-tRNA(Gln) amidotransferase GatCAB subunit C, partial [Candidatus Aenigmarchaeota archaeon]|nr:Asp-tRNA(Asn)/Glu-tRNA(Gln) amidotransferase GatCAB subunit C [Candidatus Aenigmarchaeota archaeon]
DVLREDVEEPCLSQESALANAVHKENGFFKGPKAM